MRFRLLSYVAAILLLAGVLGANLTAVKYSPNDYSHGPGGRYAEQGWPFQAMESWTTTVAYRSTWEPTAETRYSEHVRREWHWPALALDILIGLAIPIVGLAVQHNAIAHNSPRKRIFDHPREYRRRTTRTRQPSVGAPTPPRRSGEGNYLAEAGLARGAVCDLEWGGGARTYGL